jgi:hypothetical protein
MSTSIMMTNAPLTVDETPPPERTELQVRLPPERSASAGGSAPARIASPEFEAWRAASAIDYAHRRPGEQRWWRRVVSISRRLSVRERPRKQI